MSHATWLRMHSKRGLEMKKKTEIARIALFVVGSIVCAIVAISQVQAMIYDYKTLGWFGLLVDIIFCGIGVLAYFAARQFAGRQSLTAASSALKDLLARVYTMVAYLPEGKYPITLIEMSDEDVVLYAHRVIINEEFWADVPEKITIFAKSYVTGRYIMARHEPFQKKEWFMESITNAIVLGAQGIPRSKKKKQSQSPLLR